jgi:hypothetical protein
LGKWEVYEPLAYAVSATTRMLRNRRKRPRNDNF